MKKNRYCRIPCPIKRGRWMAIIFVFVCTGLTAFSLEAVAGTLPQAGGTVSPVTGVVTDVHQVPLPGVTIRLKGTSLGVSSDREGRFTLRLPEAEGVLVFSFVGYAMQEVRYRAGVPLTVRMAETATQLDEVHAIGYGSRSRRKEIGAVSSVKAGDFEGIPSASVSNLIQARVPGLRAVNESGAPGTAPKVVIRGYNSMSVEQGVRGSDPLWVIDGVPAYSFVSPVTGQNTLADIDPADIESVEVLKDAAAASIYGSRAANGVILVTTKKGRLGQKARLSLNVSHSFSFNPSLPEQTGGNAERRLRLDALAHYQTAYYDFVNGTYQYPGSYDEARANYVAYDFWSAYNAPTIYALQDSLNPFYNQSTDWYDAYYRVAQVTDASLQLSGGGERVAYSVGLGYYNERGVLIHTGYDRLKLSSNLYFRPSDRLEGNLRFYLSRSGKNRAASGMDMYTSMGGTGEIEKVPQELTGLSSLMPGPGSAAYDAVMLMLNEADEKNESYRLRPSFDLQYRLAEGLTLRSSLALDYSRQNTSVFLPSILSEYGDSYTADRTSRNMLWLNENILGYKATLGGRHGLDFLLGLSFQGEESHVAELSACGSPSDAIRDISWTGKSYDAVNNRNLKDCATENEKETMAGAFLRLNYDYDGKYIFGFTLRRDGSSTFGRDHRWGTFPSYALGYIVSEEPFMEWSRGWLDFAKLRLSYGTSGNKFHNRYLAQGSVVTGPYTFMGNVTLEPGWQYGLYNPRLTWEETRQWDAGMDLHFFSHRLTVTADYYRRNTGKLLSKVRLPGNSHGFYGQWQNRYAIRNEGVEVEVKADIFRTERLRWNLSVNFAHNWNKLVASDNDRDFVNVDYLHNISIIGKPLNGILAYDARGFYGSQEEVPSRWVDGVKKYLGTGDEYYREGDRRIADLDHDGQISGNMSLGDDRRYCGSPLPFAQGGIVSSLQWKGFDVSLLLNYSIGQHILNAARWASAGTAFSQREDEIVRPVFFDSGSAVYWQQPGDRAGLPFNRPSRSLNNFSTYLAGNVEKVHYLKLKALTIGYTFPETLLRAVRLKLFVSGENLFTLTNYSGSDPETVDIMTGIDEYRSYPLAKKITIGLTLTF